MVPWKLIPGVASDKTSAGRAGSGDYSGRFGLGMGSSAGAAALDIIESILKRGGQRRIGKNFILISNPVN